MQILLQELAFWFVQKLDTVHNKNCMHRKISKYHLSMGDSTSHTKLNCIFVSRFCTEWFIVIWICIFWSNGRMALSWGQNETYVAFIRSYVREIDLWTYRCFDNLFTWEQSLHITRVWNISEGKVSYIAWYIHSHKKMVNNQSHYFPTILWGNTHDSFQWKL